MLKKLLSVVLAGVMLLSAAALFSSCGEDEEFPVEIGKITIKEEPQNIVILDKNLSDIISAMGYDVKMVGRSDEVNQEGMSVVPSMGTAHDPSVDKIKKEKTDIVFAGDTLNDADIKKLEKAGIVVAQFESANTLKQLKSLYVKIGRMLGGNITGKRAAIKAYKEIRDTLKAVKTAAKNDKTVSTLVYLYTDNGVLKTINDGSWAATLLSYTGSVNVFSHEETDVVDLDKLLLADPNHIFVSDDEVKEYLETSEILNGLSALDGNTFVIPYDELSLQGFTSLDAMEELMSDIQGTSEDEDEADETDESSEEYSDEYSEEDA